MECDKIKNSPKKTRENKLKEVNDLFRNLLSVVNDINALHDSNNCHAKKLQDNDATKGLVSSRNSNGYSVTQGWEVKNKAVSNQMTASEYGENGNCYSNVSHDWEMKNKAVNNPTTARYVENGNCYSNVAHSWEMKNKAVSSQMTSKYGGNGNCYSNEALGWEMKNKAKSNSMTVFESKGYGDCCSNENVVVNFHLVTKHSKDQVIGIDLPNDENYIEGRLEGVVNEEASPTDVPNYFYYPFADYAHGTSDHDLESPDEHYVNIVKPTSLMMQEKRSSHVEVDFMSNEDDYIDIGLTNDPTMMNEGTVNFTTEQIRTSSNVNITNQIAETFIIPQECAFDQDSVSVEDCEVDVTCSFEAKNHRGCDNSKMFVPTSDAGPKSYCCIYCLGRFRKLERHLRTIHKKEANVKRFTSLPPRSAKRRMLIAIIRKRGEFKWNSDSKLNGGEYAVSRRPNKKFRKNPWDLVPCPECLGGYSRASLSRHWKVCTKNPLNNEHLVQQLGRAVENRLHSDASQDLVNIFATFRENEIMRNVRFDWLIIYYGNELCLNYSPHYQQGYICSKLRAAAKVLDAAKAISPELTDLSSLFHVKHCNSVIAAIRDMGKFDCQTKLFGSPATALTTVTLINAIGELLITEAMKMDDPEKERDAERFLKVFKRDVRTKINKLVAITKAKNRRNKEENIPTTEDINKLVKFLDTERDLCYSQLTKEFSYQVWLRLSQLTLVSILIYNRRRAGEMQNMTIKSFNRRAIIANQCDMILNAIPDVVKQNIKSRMIIRGKLTRTVPVLLKHSYEDCIELLIHHRTDACIPVDNKFMFSLPTVSKKIKTVNVWTIMRSFAVACGAENPSSLRGTNLRKHMASFCATQNLSDNDITNLADFMGHDDKIHRAIYRNNPLTSQITQMMSLLDAAQGISAESPHGDVSGDESEDESEDEIGDESDYDSEDEIEDGSDVVCTKMNALNKTAKKTVKPKETNNKQKAGANTKMKKKRILVSKGVNKKRKIKGTSQEKVKRQQVPKAANKKRKTSKTNTEMNKKRKT